MNPVSPAHQAAEQTPKGRESVNIRGGCYWRGRASGEQIPPDELDCFFDQITKLVVKQQM